MDILNFISWIKGGRTVTTVDSAKTLIPVGLKDSRRDDGYLAGAISVEDLAAQIAPLPTTPTLQQVLDFNHDLLDGNNFQGTGAGVGNTGVRVNAFGELSAYQNTGDSVIAIGKESVKNNIGDFVFAFGEKAALQNEKSSVLALGFRAAGYNKGENIVAVGSDAATNNTGYTVTAVGNDAGNGNSGYQSVFVGASSGASNTGAQASFLGNGSGQENQGFSVTAVGYQAAKENIGNNVIALGTNAGVANPLSGMFIISNSGLPSYPNHAAAVAAISPTGIPNNTYIYHNQATMSIGAVRL